MKFTITRERLHEGLAAVASSVPTKTTLPVLSNILVWTMCCPVNITDRDGVQTVAQT